MKTPQRTRLLKHIAYSFLFIISSCQIRDESIETTSLKQPETFLPVKKIVDGDTFWVDNGSEKGLKIRFIGVDAPESRKVFNKPVGYYGKEAKVYLTQLLSDKKVRLVSDVDPFDQYGRTLSYVYLEDGTFVNAELIKNGYAVIMTISPNVQFADYFAKLQVEARDNKRGLWNIEIKSNPQTVD
ncbi:MAG: thermonuclease family protein [Bacteroidota bacterium]